MSFKFQSGDIVKLANGDIGVVADNKIIIPIYEHGYWCDIKSYDNLKNIVDESRSIVEVNRIDNKGEYTIVIKPYHIKMMDGNDIKACYDNLMIRFIKSKITGTDAINEFTSLMNAIQLDEHKKDKWIRKFGNDMAFYCTMLGTV